MPPKPENDSIEVTVTFTAAKKQGPGNITSELEVVMCGPIAVLVDTNMAHPLNKAWHTFLSMVREELQI